jgi:hypothetical protein
MNCADELVRPAAVVAVERAEEIKKLLIANRTKTVQSSWPGISFDTS